MTKDDLLRGLGRAARKKARRHAGGNGRVDAAAPGAAPAEVIRIRPEEYAVDDEAVAALRKDPGLYQRAHHLVDVQRVDDDEECQGVTRPAGTPVIRNVPAAVLRERLTRFARFTKYDARSGEWVDAHPPGWCVSAVHARGVWAKIRHLAGLTEVPVLRADGTVLTAAGYDRSTGLLYLPGGPDVVVPESPTDAEVVNAVGLLVDLVCDFPFAAPTHKAAWLAYLLTALSRDAFDGPAPLTLVDGNVPGAGKGLLCSLVAILVTGKDVAVTAAHADNAEMKKALMSIALAGDRLVVFDNVAGTFGCAALDAALTSTRIKDRLLGGNEVAEVPFPVTLAATGNNVVLVGDTGRRVSYVRLESKEEHPEERTGFTHPDLRAYARGHRADLLGAALTLLRGYCAAGRPDQGLTPWGSYEAYSALVRSAVVWAGKVAGVDLPDPALGREELRKTSDTTAAALPALLAGVRKLDDTGQGVTVARMLAAAAGDVVDVVLVAFREALLSLCKLRPGEKVPGAQSVGMKLYHLRGRVAGGKYLQRGDDDAHVARWKVVDLVKEPDKGGAGTNRTTGTRSSPPAENCQGGGGPVLTLSGPAAGSSPRSPPSSPGPDPSPADDEEVF
jgi:hypothetical protein